MDYGVFLTSFVLTTIWSPFILSFQLFPRPSSYYRLCNDDVAESGTLPAEAIQNTTRDYRQIGCMLIRVEDVCCSPSTREGLVKFWKTVVINSDEYISNTMFSEVKV